ncbi:peroxisome biogenesis protein 1 [Dorcoceras hygrometricum]|uniref:Peroxisomal ATPase PEX1 n=1 Tax=Dorcoceras hygrometricum TaxID=472368 RepID=A0A2Z7AP50_9LAMI|nr:peroxisome biogenesis protein 1 [Dorcoceras hygrometricum]
MEFEVRIVAGAESCFVSLPLSLIQTLQSGYLPPVLALELRSDARQWHVAWCGSASTSPSSIEIAGQYAECISLSDRTLVRVRVVSNLPTATLVTIEPFTEDDWEILELNSELAESAILKQIGIVHDGMRFPLWLHGQTVVTFLVTSTFPKQPVVQLVPGTEVAVAPKRRKNPSLQSSEQADSGVKLLLRVQDSDCEFIYKYEEDGVEMDVVFTSGAFIHPETAKKHSFVSIQLAVVSSRLLSKESMDNLHSTSSKSKKEADNGNLNHKKDRQLVVRILLSESVARGHIMLPQSLRLYLGARIHSWVHLEACQINVKKDIPQVSISPCHFKMYHDDKILEKSPSEVLNSQKNHNKKDLTRRISSNPDIGIGDWSMHEKIVSYLSSVSSHVKSRDINAMNEEPNMKVGYRNGISTLLSAWCLAQTETVSSNTAAKESSLVIGCKTLVHLRIKSPTLQRHVKVTTQNNRFPKNRNQAEESSVDAIYVLSLSEESQHNEVNNAYELAFDKSSKDNYISISDVLLGKLQFGDLISFHAPHETSPDIHCSVSSLDWLGTAPADVTNRLKALLSPTSGLLFSSYSLPLPGHILIYGPPGSGKSVLAKASAKYIEGCKDILAHIVFVSCSRLALEKSSTIHKALSSYVSEALDHSPSVVIFDDLDSIIAPSSDFEGSQSQTSSAALVEFLTDILDEYEARSLCFDISLLDTRRSMCGIGPVVFIATSQSLTGVPQSLSSSGRFDFHVKLVVPATEERSAILKYEIQKRSLQCSDDLLLDIVSKCDGYDAYDLEILIDRTVHAANCRLLSAISNSVQNEKPSLVKEDFMQALKNFLPVAMRDITNPSTDGGRSGWEDVGGLTDIRNAIKEMIELPSKFPNIFAKAPLRMRSNVLLYGPPGCGKTHIVGAAAAACSLRFISVKGPELLNKYIGASEQAVRDIFSKAAAAAPCLLFFDEFDSIAPKRGHDNTGVTDRVVNQFLTELDGVEVLTGVFVFAATSRPDLLDAALLRPGRLDRLLFCDFPSLRERLDILEVLSRELPMSGDVDLEAVAYMTEGFSGADLQALLSDTQLEAVHKLLDIQGGNTSGKMPVITNALLMSVASKAKPSVADAEKRRLYGIYSQFLDAKRSVAAKVSLFSSRYPHECTRSHTKCVTCRTNADCATTAYIIFYSWHL